MNGRRKLDVGTWSGDVPSPISDTRPPRRFWPPGTFGLLGSLIVHLLVVQSVLLGSRAHKLRPPDVQGPGATPIKSESDRSEALILMELPTIAAASKVLSEDLASAGSAPKNFLLTIVNADPLPHIEIPQDALGDNNDASASIDSGDPVGRARLFGIYSGQIEARIKRAWRRPRSPVSMDTPARYGTNVKTPSIGSVSAETFACQVRIIQNAAGFVQEVQMLNCNGGTDWRQSLVAAILSASPLPAPPNPSVFTYSLTMTFDGQPYTPGGPAEDYALE